MGNRTNEFVGGDAPMHTHQRMFGEDLMAGTWQPLANQPTFNTSTMLLLTDGRVMVQEEGTAHWHALSPDDSGSYVNGTWSPLADMSFWRRYYASGILKDGRMFVCGGEQSGDVNNTKKGEIYDPVSDFWTSIPQPSMLPEVGDAACCVLPDGRVLIGALSSTACAIYDPKTNSWSTAGSKAMRSNEETWVLQPDGTILTVQCFSPYNSEKYVIASNSWKNEGKPPVTLVDSVMAEIGPAMLLCDGRTIYFGAAGSSGQGKTALYTPATTSSGTGSWTAGPDIPKIGGKAMVANDCPASLLPNGKVLFTAAQYQNNNWGQPIQFFEYDPVANSISQVPSPANNNAQLYWSRLMLLPTGQVLFSPSSNDIEVYTPDGAPQAIWRPMVSAINADGMTWPLQAFTLTGTQLNGLSQANLYGDDCYPATNYPLVRLRDTGTGAVSYARTYDFSTMGVATGAAVQSCRFACGVPGSYELTVIANGIGSLPVPFYLGGRKPQILEVGVKLELEVVGKIIAEGDIGNWRDWAVNPVINELQKKVLVLQNDVRRLTTMIRAQELPRVGLEAKRSATERFVGLTGDGEAKQAATDNEAKTGGESKKRTRLTKQ
jgi:hypothetical protein